MIHYSNIKCDTCGERHSPDHTTECRDVLLARLDALHDEIADISARAGNLQRDIDKTIETFFSE